MKRSIKLFSAVLLILSALTVLMIGVYATDASAASGYVIATGGAETNIKWEVVSSDNEVILSFNIDPAAADKTQTTVLYGVNTAKGSLAGYGEGAAVAWGAYQTKITHIKVGDGITEIVGGIANSFSALKTVEIPKSLTAITDKAFVGETNLVSIYYRGNEPVEGEADLTTLTKLGSYVFDNCKKLSSFKLAENYAGVLDSEAFKWTAVKEFTVPAGVTAINRRTLGYCKSLESVWCYATNYTLDSSAFDSCDKLTYIYGIPGTPLEEYCREKDISFRNINNPEEYIYKSTKEPEIFDPTGATAYGNIINEWNGGVVVDVYWLFYEDTKTLKFISNKTGHNETGNCSYDKENQAWEEYKNLIEHAIIGKGISKISQKAFQGMTALKTVEIRGNITQIDTNAFDGCTSLTTIYYNGKTPVEGTADLSTMTKLGDNVFRNTAILNFILAVNTPTMGENIFPGLTASITCTPNDDLIAYAEEYFVDIIDLATGQTVSKNYVYIDQSLPFCGSKAVFSFDAATGTLTISGVGPIADIVNYYGGGSKTQFWFEFKQDIKKVIIEDGITAIGKYSFTQCKNLEYVELPAKGFVIGNGAFESCENLKSIYVRGNAPIIGHLDLSGIAELNSWTFSQCYLIANITVSSAVDSIGASVFDTCPNLLGIYGTPGSYAEEFAADNGYSFNDISAAKPADTVCEKPAETTEAPETTSAPESENAGDATDTSADTGNNGEDSETKPTIDLDFDDDTEPAPVAEGGSPVKIIIIAAAVVAIAAVVIIIVMKKKR